jgi:hypothetical protein
MKIIEILTFNRELLEKLRKIGVSLEDCRYIDLYNDYKIMHDKGLKVTYIVAVLSAKYDISERKVYSLIKQFRKDCKNAAAQ